MNITPDEVLRLAESMTGREREVLDLHYGITGDRYSVPEIARIFRVTRERARQMVERAERQLRVAVADFHVTDEAIRCYLLAGLARRKAALTTDTIDTCVSDRT